MTLIKLIAKGYENSQPPSAPFSGNFELPYLPTLTLDFHLRDTSSHGRKGKSKLKLNISVVKDPHRAPNLNGTNRLFLHHSAAAPGPAALCCQIQSQSNVSLSEGTGAVRREQEDEEIDQLWTTVRRTCDVGVGTVELILDSISNIPRQKSSLPSRLPYARHRLHVPPPESAPYPPDERSRSPPKPELDRLCLPLSLIDIVLDADAVIQPQPGPRGSGSANKKDSDSVMSRTFDAFYSAIMTTEGRDGAVERELSNHQREIIDTCFEEGQFESAIALMEQLRTSNAKLAVSYKWPLDVPSLPSKAALKKGIPSGPAVHAARRLLSSYAITNLPEMIARAVPCFDDPRKDQRPHNIDGSLESVIGPQSMCIPMAKSCWHILTEGFTQHGPGYSLPSGKGKKRAHHSDSTDEHGQRCRRDADGCSRIWSLFGSSSTANPLSKKSVGRDVTRKKFLFLLFSIAWKRKTCDARRWVPV
ncbi:hypothetical protein D9615_005378 [Tricholomella constricta]|uniref:Uncharacterized protein n=1 Tax=Tricholomella constricta TaxID=117010 RepID=A0A8H5HF01_9AGAR|nr:hypothetical protein D9615_005378 [Tricholomella constricta]